MNKKRALGFSLLLYIASFLLYGIVQLVPQLQFPALSGYIALWVINVPLVLLLAKWYFKKISPTAKNGLFLGLAAIVVALIIDGLFFLLAGQAGQATEAFAQMYSSWMFYVTIGEVILLCAYAGYEFDGTYSGTA